MDDAEKITALREALEPFADALDFSSGDGPCLTEAGVRAMHNAVDIEDFRRASRVLTATAQAADPPAPQGAVEAVAPLSADDVEWVVNSIAELGVKIGDQFFFLYKGDSLVYRNEDQPLFWRPVFKREFGECCHPINYKDPRFKGSVSLDDSDEWQPLPVIAEEETP